MMENQILNEADKVIGNLMLEINRLINELLLKDKKIDQLKKEVKSWYEDRHGEMTDEEFLQKRNFCLKIANGKICNKCNNTGWVCECHPDKETHKCCGGTGMPCECTKESE